MHRIAALARPVTTPDEAVPFEYFDDAWIHITRCAHSIGLCIEVDSYPPTLGGKFGPVSDGAIIETAAVRDDLALEMSFLDSLEDALEHRF